MPPVDIAGQRRPPDQMTDGIDGAATVTPSDTVDLPFLTRALYVSVAGSVRVTMRDGMVQDYPILIAGRHAMRVTRVHETGTTATGLVAEY